MEKINKKVLLIGEPLGLFIAKELGKLENVENFVKKIAGAELNVAIGLSRLGYEVEYVTKLGNDPFGKSIEEFLKKENIGTKYIVKTNDKCTGFMLKSKVENRDPDIYYYRKNSAATTLNLEDVKKINLDEFDLIHITGIPLGISKSFRESIIYLLNEAKKLNKYITFDPNLRLQMWEDKEEMKEIINDICKKVDLILPGISECELLISKSDIEDIKNEYLKLGVKSVVLKDGPRGSYFFKDGISTFVKGFKVEKVIDTVGAGDGFAVGIISSILENLSVEEMLERGNAIGSIQVQHVSDNEGLPKREELIEYIKERKE